MSAQCSVPGGTNPALMTGPAGKAGGRKRVRQVARQSESGTERQNESKTDGQFSCCGLYAVRPKPPQQVSVKPKDRNWMVEWTQPASKPDLYYHVCYYKTTDQGCSVLENISKGSMALMILGDSLVPSQLYQVKVRSLVVPDLYQGVPSEWSPPVDWTSHEATWSVTKLIYVTISVFVTAVVLGLYFSIPACQRRVILWVDSVPSPAKSKILSEMKAATSSFKQDESATMCRVLSLDSEYTCSSDALLWPTKDTEKKRLQVEHSWKCGDLPPPNEKVSGSDTSSMSFSGPYIFCQSSESESTSMAVNCEEKEQEAPTEDPASPSRLNFALFGEGYVCLPNRNVSRSTQDLVSHSSAHTNSAEQNQQSPVEMDVQLGLNEPISSPQTQAFTSWPEGGATQASGYCHLPGAK